MIAGAFGNRVTLLMRSGQCLRADPAKRGGNKRSVNERAVISGLLSIVSTGCQ